MTEKKIEKGFCRLVRRAGCLVWKLTSPQQPGAPDRILVTPWGVVWFLEFKRHGGRLSALQREAIMKLESRGANVKVLCGWNETRLFAEWLHDMIQDMPSRHAMREPHMREPYGV